MYALVEIVASTLCVQLARAKVCLGPVDCPKSSVVVVVIRSLDLWRLIPCTGQPTLLVSTMAFDGRTVRKHVPSGTLVDQQVVFAIEFNVPKGTAIIVGIDTDNRRSLKARTFLPAMFRPTGVFDFIPTEKAKRLVSRFSMIYSSLSPF